MDCTEPSADGVTEAGLKDFVAPPGSPEMSSDIAELKPPTEATVTVDAAELPGASVSVFGEADMVKSGPDSIVKCIGVEWVIEPLVPTTLMSYVPGLAETLAVRLKVEVVEPPAEGVTGDWLNDGITPDGRSEQLRDTGELKPPKVDVTVIVEVPAAPPLAMLNVFGEAETLKSAESSSLPQAP